MDIKNVFYFNLFFTLIISYSDNYNNLYKWLINNGAYISKKIFPREESPFNRYILTKEKIYQKEKILFIPNQLTISPLHNIVLEKCQKDFKEYYSCATKEEKSSFDYDCLVYFLTTDIDNKQSFYKDYYNYLPKISKLDFILYFNEEEINDLNKIELDIQIRRQNFFLNKALKPVKKIIDNMENGLDKFKNNFIYVSTRNFGRRGSFFEDVNTLVPYLDLLNHDNNYNSWFYYDEKRDGFILFAIKDIEKNEEITVSYGRLNNIYLYTMYGFTIKDNIYKPSILLEVEKEKFTLFERVKEEEIIKVVKYFTSRNIMEKTDAINIIRNSLENKLNEYGKYIQSYQNNLNIINICEDLSSIVKQYIILCENLI